MDRKENIPDGLMTKFLSGKRLSNHEITLLDQLFNDGKYYSEISDWLKSNWKDSEQATVALTFEEIKRKIKISSGKNRMSRLSIVLSKVAAVLFIPLLFAALYFYFNQSYSHGMLTFATQKGEQTNVILPDGSEVWLNVDTKLSYPVDFGIKNRNLLLEGEAYFEVKKNKDLPFTVASGNIVTEAVGTHFVVSAYPESPQIRTSLTEGRVKVKLTDREYYKILKPGQQFIIDKKNSQITVKLFDNDYELGWKNDELIFRLTPFDDVITKLEKWYDIDIEYKEALFRSETLTVKFEKYETLENVFKVISKAIGFNYSIEKTQIKIMKKK